MPDSYDEHVKLMFDMQVVAFASDVTRVVAFKLSRDVSNRVYPETGVNTGFHIASHHGEREDRILDLAKINKYHVSLVPYFLKKLKETPDGDSNLLENSLLIYGSPMGNSNVHNHKRCPLFLAGHAGGALKGNLHIKAADGTPMANAMLGALRGVGLELDTFGDSNAVMDLNKAPEADGGVDANEDHATFLALALLSAALDVVARTPSGPSDIADAAQAKNAAAVKKLLKKGADVNAAQGDGMTALHWAALNGDAEVAQMLLYAGANVGAKTRIGGYTPLHLAAQVGNASVIAPLVAAGAQVGAADRHRRDRADAGRAFGQHGLGAHPARERRRSEREGNRQRPDRADVRRGRRSPRRGEAAAGARRGSRRDLAGRGFRGADDDQRRRSERRAASAGRRRRREARTSPASRVRSTTTS